MLVLSRKLGEKIIIGQDVIIAVLDVKGDTVKLGVDAPRHVTIYREEIYQDVVDSNQIAQATAKVPQVLNDTLSKVNKVPVVKKSKP
jgi:carbon storage regulator